MWFICNLQLHTNLKVEWFETHYLLDNSVNIYPLLQKDAVAVLTTQWWGSDHCLQLSHITPHSSATFTGGTKIRLYMHAWWMHTKLAVQSTISYRGHTIRWSTRCVLLCKMTAWNCKVTRIAPSSFNNHSVIQRHHSVNYVRSSHLSIICTLRHRSNILCEVDSSPTLSVIWRNHYILKAYSQHFLYLALLCVQCTNLAGLMTLVLASWSRWKNSDYTILHYCMKINVWQT